MMNRKQGMPDNIIFLLFDTFFYLTMVKISFIICRRLAVNGRVNLAYCLISEPETVEDRQGCRFENHPGALTFKVI